MSVFGNYSLYYDLLYKDKNYQAEADFIDKIILKYKPNAKTVLNLGCGTGKHDFLLAKKGYHVTGVDISAEMLNEAKSTLKITKLKDLPKFIKGDIRSIKLAKKYDVITSLFHVVSYLTSNNDLGKFFETAKSNLKPNGLLFFDFWYGPAVLTIKPEIKVKRLENSKIKVTRIAEPVLRENENIVNVNYDVFIQDKKNGNIEELKETHSMRYLFLPELKILAEKFKLNYVSSFSWLTSKPSNIDTWASYTIMSN